MLESMSADAEVLIVGAGPAGSALAIMLGEAGVDTVLLDREGFPRDKPCGEGLMPAGVEVLGRLGITLDAYPRVAGVTYRVPRAGSARGYFLNGMTGRGVRRIKFDAMLAGRAGTTPNVRVECGAQVMGLERRGAKIAVKTRRGEVVARTVVGADGLHSQVARWAGWSRAPRRPHRYAFVGHADAPAHGVDSVLVTILDGCEVYTAPTGADELLVAVLGTKPGLRHEGETAGAAYARHVAQAHPELSVDGATVRGAGPFWMRPTRVAGERLFLIGDAAGFLDPLTGDGMSDALVAAEKLTEILASRRAGAEQAYARWEARRWRRRVAVGRLALLLSGSSVLARRALRRMQSRPLTLNRLLEVNDGRRSLWSLTPRDWAALAGV